MKSRPAADLVAQEKPRGVPTTRGRLFPARLSQDWDKQLDVSDHAAKTAA